MNAKEMFESIGWKKVKKPAELEPIFNDFYSNNDIVYEFYHEGDWTYGRIEVRAKIPVGQGMWPAIWTFTFALARVILGAGNRGIVGVVDIA